jgi:hypothetical protein
MMQIRTDRTATPARRALPPALPLAFAFFLALLSPLPSSAQSSAPGFKLSGMVSVWSTGRFDTSFEPVFSLRFIPEAAFSFKFGRGVTVDAEASANAFGSAFFFSQTDALTEGEIKPYRGWVRLSTSRFEARVGLQKLSFGSATIFRPLMWFDSIDPRDPLQLTDGVYGLLLRYYTKGNANFWAWGLYGNDGARGWDLAPPDEKTPEFGGRVEVPLFKGELAATYHRRKAAIDGLTPIMSPPPGSPLPVAPVPEDRFAVDGKWDLGVGVWFEGSLTHQRTPLLPLSYQRALTLGMDYTFGLGRGLNVMAEQFRLASSASAFGRGDGLSFSGLLLRYPLGLLDEVTGIFYYDWKNRNVYRFVFWKRTYDSLSLNLMLFWNPEELLVFQGQPGSSSFAGTGFQLLLAFYF